MERESHSLETSKQIIMTDKETELREVFSPIKIALIEMYEEYPPVLSNKDIEPGGVIENFFKHAEIMMGDIDSESYRLAFRSAVKEMQCFKYVLYSCDKPWIMWNPFELAFTQFVKEHPKHKIQYFPKDQYPTRLQVEFWLKLNANTEEDRVVC